MGTKLPIISGKKLLKALKKAGFVEKRQSGSHVIITGNYKGKDRFTTVPIHSGKDLPNGTLLGILEDCGMTKAELKKRL